MHTPQLSSAQAHVLPCPVCMNGVLWGAVLSCRVGDTFAFGQSSRMFVLTGPSELMPDEGLSKQQRKQLAMLEAAQVGRSAGR